MAVQPNTSSAVSADLIYTDDLTGLRNRRFLYQVFGEGWQEITGDGRELSLAIVDLDYFKQVNDTHGHLTGDLVLAETADLFGEFLGEEDHAIRYGGDEFVLLLPCRSKDESRELLERLRAAMADKEFVSKEENEPLEVVLSFSIGVATFPEDASTGEELVAAADKALYASKKAGRNCVRVSGDLPADLEDEIDRFRTFPCKTVVGRREIIEALGAQCDLVNMGTGTWTALSGPAGVGKTRLLGEALRAALDSGISCAMVDLEADEAEQPFAGIVRIVKEAAGRYPGVGVALARDADPALVSFLRASGCDLGMPIEATTEETMPPPEILGQRLTTAVRRLCERRRWLFLLDEVQNLDTHSAQLLQDVIEGERLPIGIVSAHRSDDSRLDDRPGIESLVALDRKPWLDRREVEPLPIESMEVMVSVLLPNLHAPSDFAQLLFEVTAGNPLFVEEILRLGIARETITRRGGEWFITPLDRRDLPETLEEAIEQRLTVLDREIGAGISRAAAIGNSLTPDVLQALLGKNEGEVLGFLDKAREQGFVAGGQQGDLSTVRFTSASLRDRAYERLSQSDRTRAHREIGKIEEHRGGSLVAALAGRLAYHFERGEVYEKAKAYLEAARAAAPPMVVAGAWDASEVPKHRRRRITEAAVPLPDEAWASVDEALRAITQASKALWMYPADSPMALAASRDLHQTLVEVLEHAEVVSLAAVEGSLVINGVPYPPRRQESLVRGLLEQFRSRQIRGFTLRQGLTESEAMFLVSQLVSQEAVQRDPEVWEALLEERGIENVDFDDRVYVPAEGVANAPVDPSGLRRQSSGVLRVASAEELAEAVRESSGDPADGSLAIGPEAIGVARPVSSADLEALLQRLEEDASIDAEIESLVPMVAELLRRLLASAGDAVREQHREWARAAGAKPSAENPAIDPTGAARTAVCAVDGLSDSDVPGITEMGVVATDLRGGEWGRPQRLFAPAEMRFEACVHGRKLDRATQILRFVHLCERLDDGDGELAAASRESLVGMGHGGSIPLLLADLSAAPEQPDPLALELLRGLGDNCGSVLATYLRETDDLRARRVIARTLREIGGQALGEAVDSITHGDNPVVARRVLAVLEDLSADLAADLERAVTVRNPAVLGEAIKVLQRQPRRVQIQVIGSLLFSASPELVCRGVYYLSEWNFTEAKDSVLMLLRESEDLEILAGVTAALARWRLPQAVPILAELLRRKQVMKIVPFFPRGLRREFARALAAIDTSEARRELRDFVRDVDPEVRNIARGMPAPSGA